MTISRALYDNNLGMKDKLASFWEHVAQSLSSNKYIVAFDPLNEPSLGGRSLWDNLKTLYPGNLDRTKIQPLYDAVYKTYSKVDQDAIMAFEPSPLPPDIMFNVGFDAPPGAKKNSAHHIMNEHTYCCGVFSDICFEDSAWYTEYL